MTNSLPPWIGRLLGIETGPGEGTAWSLDHSWGWPPWVTLLAVVFAGVFVVTTYLRESRQTSPALRVGLAAIRLALVAIVLVMLAQIALSLNRTGLPYVALIVDDSLSMGIVDRYDENEQEKLRKRIELAGGEQLSRWNLARTLLVEKDGALLGDLQQDYKLRTYFLTGPRPARSNEVDELVEEVLSLEPSGESTRLGAAIRTTLGDFRGSAPAAIVLLTDGINTEGPALAEGAAEARRLGVPLLIVGLGEESPIRDLKLTDLLVEEVVFVGDVVYFEVKLSGAGYEGQKVRLVLRRKGFDEVLAELDVTVGPDGQPQQLRLPYRAGQEGEFRYVVEVEPVEGELETDNNRQERTVRVAKRQIRVLVVQAYPSFEFRYLRNMLDRDSTVELNTVLQDADPEHAEQDSAALPGFPVRREELFSYDVIVLGDVDPAMLTGAMIQNLADFVDQPATGGALVLIAGAKYMPWAYRDTPLARLMPVELGRLASAESRPAITEGFVVWPTDLGLASPQMQLGDTLAETTTIWKNLPPLYWMLQTPELKPGARVLAEHPYRRSADGRRLPLICMQYVGAGKVLYHGTDETWRWRWRVGDAFFARYWVQTFRALSRSVLSQQSRSAVLSADRREYRRGDPVRLRLRFTDERLAPAEDDGVTVMLERTGHQTQRIKLWRSAIGRGIFESLLSDSAIGSYHAWVAIPMLEGQAPAVDFSVAAPPGEFERMEMASADLKRAAEKTKGRFYTFSTAGRLLRDLPEGRRIPVESLPPRPLWNTWPLLLLFLVLLTTEWILRKAGGMV